MNRLIIICLLLITCTIVTHAQQNPGIDASIETAKTICQRANQTYLADLNAKKTMIVEKASPALAPFVDFIDSETSYLGV